MSQTPRRARLRALAKINLSLKVLHKRPDGFHELRTIFQTISLADTIDVEYTPARRTSLELKTSIEIPSNLVLRAAELALDAMRVRGRFAFRLEKRIPIGGGLGGGSSDAAAVLLALPVLAGRRMPLDRLVALAAELGSDVPFFLLGGTALGIGRGAELYPLPPAPPASGLLVIPPVSVSTASAYRALNRQLTTTSESPIMSSLQGLSWSLGRGLSTEVLAALGENDFEHVVFRQHPQLRVLQHKLLRLGAAVAMLSGSGSALFGIFTKRSDVERARLTFRKQTVEPFSLVSRERYRVMWWRCLQAHINGRLWPPQSRYVQ